MTQFERQVRYAYSSIESRPAYEWPNGTRLAVYIANNVEVFRYGVGKGAAIAPPDQAVSDSVYSWRDYGNRVGFWTLMDALDKYALPAEAQMNTAIYDECPDIPARHRARGDEFLGHGYTNSDEQGDQPIWMATRGGKILSMPYPIECNDNRGIVWFRYTSEEFAQMLIDQLDEMLEQSAKYPLVCPISLHPFVVGRPYRLRALRRVFEHIDRNRDRIWLTRPGEIAAHIANLPAGIVPGS